MRSISIIWLFQLVLFGSFVAWHTSWKEPLSETEVHVVMERLAKTRPFPKADLEIGIEAFLAEDDGRPFYMVNLDNVLQTEEAKAADQAYGQTVIAELLKRGSYPVLLTWKSALLKNDFGGEVGQFDRLSVIRYRSRRDFADMITSDAFLGAVGNKWISLEGWMTAPTHPVLEIGLALLVPMGLVVTGSLGTVVLVLRSRGA